MKKNILFFVITAAIVLLIAGCDTGSQGAGADKTSDTSSNIGTTIPDANEDEEVTVEYTLVNTAFGKITGEKKQTVNKGETSTSAVTAVPKLGYKFVRWSDENTSATRLADCPDSDTVYTAKFDYDAQELPILDIWTDDREDIISKTEYKTGTITVANTANEYKIYNQDIQIRGRGNYSWKSTFNDDPRYNKRPYRIKFEEKTNLLGIGNGEAKSWVLIANHCDQSLLRNQTSYQFAKSLENIIWQPSVISVEVYLNGRYNGVYLLTEQVQVNPNRIDLSEDYESSEEIDFLIHRSGYAQYPSFEIDEQPYEIVNDLSSDTSLEALQIEYIRSRIEECWNALKEGDLEKIESLMDLPSFVDVYIVQELFKNLDVGWDNFYMFSEVDGKLHFGPVWDLDQCAGNANEGVEDYRNLRVPEKNKWFSHAMQQNWFREMVLERFDELLPEIRKIPETIKSSAAAGYNSYCRNFERWDIWGLKINREMDHIRAMHTYQEHVDYFAQWMELRIDWLDKYLHTNDFIGEPVSLALKGDGTETSPYLITSSDDFLNFTQVLQSGYTFENEYLSQTSDIDMTDSVLYNGIGTPHIFSGNYNGNGHTITAHIGGSDNSFFPYVNGTIKNLITAGEINNSGITGGVARSVRVGGVIANCGSKAVLSSLNNVGGIVPSNQAGGGTIIGCWFTGKITNSANIGPINCYASGRMGVFHYNYFISDYTSANNRKRETKSSDSKDSTPDTPFDRDALAEIIEEINNNRTVVAAAIEVDTDHLVSWDKADMIDQ